MSRKISYSNIYSVGGKAINDINIGIKNGVVGSNSVSMKDLTNETLIVITDSNKRLIQISEIIGPASNDEAGVWERAGGKNWKYNYRIRPLTLVVKLTTYLKIIVNERTNGNDSLFWDNRLHHTSSKHTSIVRKLIEEINGE